MDSKILVVTRKDLVALFIALKEHQPEDPLTYISEYKLKSAA